MLTLSRILLLRCNYVSRSAGVFEECVTNKKSIHFIQRLNFCTTVKTKDNPVVKHDFDYENSKPKHYDYSVTFKQILTLIHKSDRDINKCLPALNRMITIYHNERPDHKLSFDLSIFLMSKEFKKFCGILHKHLPNLKPDVLVNLLSMEHFGVPVNSILMQKVLVLILDNINSYTAFDKVFIYATISRKYFENSEQCADLKKALDVYLETMFDQELEHFKISVQAIPLMQNENVPVKVKKKIAEKIIRDSVSTPSGNYSLHLYLEAIFIQPVPLFSPAETIEILRRANKIKPTGMLSSIVSIYKKLVEIDSSFYNESFCNDLANSASALFSLKIYKIANDLCSLGHLNDDLLKTLCERASVLNIAKLGLWNALPVASTFARSCVHERNIFQPEAWEGLKLEFQSCHFKQDRISHLNLLLCEFLTFLGCDTRNLFSVIFQAIEQDKLQGGLDTNYCILRFHHLAKAYFSEECATLSDETLTKIMAKSAAKNNSFPTTLIDFIGGEDYLLKNCTTSDNHFLHYVAVLGPDNKPINLSSFKQKATPVTPLKLLYNIEDIERPSGSKLVVFQNFPDPQPIMFYNAPVMSGMAKIYLKSFESLNCDIVLLPRKTNSEYLKSQLNEIIQKHEEKKIIL